MSVRVYIAAAAVLGSLAAFGAGAKAQGGWPDCEKNMCDAMGGNCQLVSHQYNCNETVEPLGCSDKECNAT